MTPKVLFILKHRNSGPVGSWNHSQDGKPLDSGLSISATQMAFALDELNIDNKLVQVIDNNCIDREVTQYQPTHVIIEAFWVVPEKFTVLRKLHPSVTWVVRNHSKSDFLSHEGGMIGWALDYVKNNVILGCNSPEATEEFKKLAAASGGDPELVIYLPNFYKTSLVKRQLVKILIWKFLRAFGIRGAQPTNKSELKIGCFGAIRPLKNTVHQAMAAIQAAENLKMALHFYVNGNRVEGRGEPILRSLQALFERFPQHKLVELPWMGHDEFVAVSGTMDVVMQVSNSDTFNIVSADAVIQGVPVLVSPEIPWLDCEYTANPNSVDKIRCKLLHTYLGSQNGFLQADQLFQLYMYSKKSKHIWGAFLAQPDKV